MAPTWATSWGTSWASSWGRTATPEAETPAVGGGRSRRRRHIIDGIIYEGTEEQLEALLWELLNKDRPEPVKTKPVRKRKNPKPVELKRDYVPPPLVLDLPKFEQLVADTYRHEDAFMRAMLKRMLKRWEDDEDDAEVLLLTVH